MSLGLKVRNLSFEYGPKRALDDVSFVVEPGSFCALLGPNDASKSTLISLLTRLLVNPSGEISIAGHNLLKSLRSALADLGVVFQQATIDLNQTVRQNLAYLAALHGLACAETPRRIDAALKQLGMLERANEKARALNGGHRRRMELARVLLHEPKVLLLDEPTVGLDAAPRRGITEHMHNLAKAGLSVLWTTHLPDEVRDSNRLLVLHQGKILADGTAGVICEDQSLSDWFLSKTEVLA